MKRILFLLLAIQLQCVYGQNSRNGVYLTFENNEYKSCLVIDTVSCPDNLWQVGHCHKPGVDSSACPTTVIMTDTAFPYPVNNVSEFSIRIVANMGAICGCLLLEGDYYVQSDSLHDAGKIEFSPDNGLTWFDILKDAGYSTGFNWYTPKPVLTGHSGTCKTFGVMMAEVGSVFNVVLGDTMAFRFSFFSDSIPDSLCGLIIDNLTSFEFVEGISEIHFMPIRSRIYPNPGTGVFTIEFDNPAHDPFELSVYDLQSKPVLKRSGITENQVTIKSGLLPPGTYIYKATNLKSPKRCWGKFIVSD